MRKKDVSSNFIKLSLSQALVKLMYEKNYNDINISNICKEAGFCRTTYYRHFSNNKEDLLLFIADFYWQGYVSQNEELYKKNEFDFMLNHIYNFKDFFLLLKKNDLLYLIYKIIYYVFRPFDDMIDKVRYPYSFVIGGYYGIIHELILDEFNLTPEEVKNKIKDGLECYMSISKK